MKTNTKLKQENSKWLKTETRKSKTKMKKQKSVTRTRHFMYNMPETHVCVFMSKNHFLHNKLKLKSK